jgi:uncharacterized cupredoxin-like copper-binding protein
MKRLIVALSALAAVSLAAPAANAVDVCAYTVSGALGIICPVRLGDTVCLSASTITGSCDTTLQCFGGAKFFCLATLRPKSGPQAQCPAASKRPTGFKCFAPARAVPTRTPTPIPTTVNVTLKEFSVTPDVSSAPAGHINFHVSNIGEDMHEFLVIRTDLAPDMLPTEANGSYLEDGPGTDLLDEIDLVPSGESRDLGIDLTPGNYVLICNMVHTEDNGDIEVHYQLGMHTAFTVQ